MEHLIDTAPSDEVTARLNEVYATEDSRLEPDLVRAQRRAIGEAC